MLEEPSPERVFPRFFLQLPPTSDDTTEPLGPTDFVMYRDEERLLSLHFRHKIDAACAWWDENFALHQNES
jgi:hypothetical protein